MKIESHVHTATSPNFRVAPDHVIRPARRRGLDGVAVADHNSSCSWDTLTAATCGAPTIRRGDEVFTDDGELLGVFLDREVGHGLTLFTTALTIEARVGVIAAAETHNGWTLSWGDHPAAAACTQKHQLPVLGGCEPQTTAETDAASFIDALADARPTGHCPAAHDLMTLAFPTCCREGVA